MGFDADGQPRNPDRLVIDLDPGTPAGLHECAQLALMVRARPERIALTTAPVASGSKGMQLYAAHAYPLRSGRRQRAWTGRDDLAVVGGLLLGLQAQQSLEGGHRGASSVEPEGVLVYR